MVALVFDRKQLILLPLPSSRPKTFQMCGINHTILNKEFTECVVDFGCAKFVTKGHEGVFEHICVDFAVDFEGIESLEDGVIIISTSGHLLCEKHNHLCEVDGSGGFCEHALGLTIGNGFANRVEGGDNVSGRQKTVFVCVHDTESFLELLDLPLGEESKNVGAALLGLL